MMLDWITKEIKSAFRGRICDVEITNEEFYYHVIWFLGELDFFVGIKNLSNKHKTNLVEAITILYEDYCEDGWRAEYEEEIKGIITDEENFKNIVKNIDKGTKEFEEFFRDKL